MATKTKKKTKATPVEVDEAPILVPPPTLDVDVTDVEEGDGDEENGPLVLPGYWVILGKHKAVPASAVGHHAAVLSSPWANAPVGTPLDAQPIVGYTFDEGKLFTVRTRDEANQLLEVPEAAFTTISETRVGLGR